MYPEPHEKAFMDSIRLKPGKEKKIRNHYLWIFRDDIATLFRDRQEIPGGSVVAVNSSDNHFLGIGFYNSKSHIVCRMLSKQNVRVDRDFFYHRLKKIIQFRESLRIPSDSFRLVHSEADLMPGLIADQYYKHLVVQFRTLGMDLFRKDIMDILIDLTKPEGIVERSDMESRTEEGLETVSGVLYGRSDGPVQIGENGVHYRADIVNGHKTGFYLDQRDNRLFVKSLIKSGNRCLDLFCYTGGFSVALACAGVHVTGIDQDEQAIQSAGINAAINGVQDRCRFITGDVYDFLENTGKNPQSGTSGSYDMIIIDPPAIVKRKEGIDKLKWAFWKLMNDALPLLNRGGYMVVSSCAYHMSVDLLLEAARFASADNQCRLRMHTITYQPPDHPWILQVPETLYLKTVYFQKI